MAQNTLVILAAGIGSRFGGIKQLAQVSNNGDAILDLTIQDAIAAGYDSVVHIIRKDIEGDYCKHIAYKYSSSLDTRFAYQELGSGRSKPRGVADALCAALPFIDGHCAVVNADDYYGSNAMRQAYDMLDYCDESNFGMIGYVLKNTLSENGTVNRGVCKMDDRGFLTAIQEMKGIKSIGGVLHTNNGTVLDKETIVSMNFRVFRSDILASLPTFVAEFKADNKDCKDAELPLPPYIDYLIGKGKKCKVVAAQDKRIGITYREDLVSAKQALNNRFTLTIA